MAQLLVIECDALDATPDSDDNEDRDVVCIDQPADGGAHWSGEDETKCCRSSHGHDQSKGKGKGKDRGKIQIKPKSKRQARRESEALARERRKREQQQRRRRRERRRRCEDHATWKVRLLAAGDTEQGVQDPSWSCDGEWLAFTKPLTSVSEHQLAPCTALSKIKNAAERPAVEELCISTPTPDECFCSICLEDIGSDLAKLQCGHCFHAECIALWQQRSGTCPCCRDEGGLTGGDGAAAAVRVLCECV